MAREPFNPYDENVATRMWEDITGITDSEYTSTALSLKGRSISSISYDPKDEEDYEDDPNYTAAGISDQAPAPLTDIPTSSTDAGRPRTVAAGYDKSRKVMTVMFRDGTLYNYYEVEPGEWQNFHSSISKGNPWLNRGYPKGRQQVDGLFIGKPRGPADLSGISDETRSTIYRVSRTAQVRYQYRGKVPKSAATKANLVPKTRVQTKQNGKNRSKGGTNPHKPKR